MPVLATSKPVYIDHTKMKQVPVSSNNLSAPTTSFEVPLRSLTALKQSQSSTSIQRRSLNISHFNALHSAVSNLARIDDFDLEELGYGYYSDVFKATHQQTGQVMVLKRNKDTNSKMNIMREIQLMNRLSHPNVLRFRGVCVHEGKLHALTEFINGGDLDKFATNKDIVLTWKQRMHLALDVARGIKYLHSMGIFHRDLSSKNCLVQIDERKNKKKYTCIVADLGLAEKIPTTPEEEAQLSMVGTPYIMAPEVLGGKPYNETADIFSYGLIVCQLIARVSYDPEQLPRSQDFGLARDLFQKMVSGPTPTSCADNGFPPPNSFLQLAYDCCQIDPKSRPSFKDIVSRLEQAVSRRSHVISPTLFRVGGDLKYRLSGLGYSSSSNNKKAGSPPLTASKVMQLKSEHLSSNKDFQRTRVRSTSKLTRSYSDISRELIQHAASVVSSTWDEESDEDDSDEEDGFLNPFEELEHLNCNHIKLIDEPSLALLEMTFDLASTESLRNPLHLVKSGLGKKRRPNSTYADDQLTNLNHDHIDHHRYGHHSSSSIRLHPRTQELRGEEQDGRNPKASCSEELLSQCQGCSFQRARHRAMILSPLGSHLASWWRNRHGDFKDEDVENQRRSMATVISVLSRGLLNLRRSISVPDLSQSSSLFHHADAQAENRIRHTLDIPSHAIGPHSWSSDELFESSGDQNISDASTVSQTASSNLEGVPQGSSSGPSNSSNIELLQADLPTMSNSLEMSFKSGEIIKEQRAKSHDSYQKSISPVTVPECIVTDLSGPPNCNNRDSGYEESLSIPQSTSESVLNHTWSIPEELPPTL